jgi:hypothetical protein
VDISQTVTADIMVHLITMAAVTTREENKNYGHVPKILGRDFFC